MHLCQGCSQNQPDYKTYLFCLLAIVQCYLEFKILCFKNPKLYINKVKAFFEDTVVLQQIGDWLLYYGLASNIVYSILLEIVFCE